MDNKTKAKYIGVLLNTVRKVDDSMFALRVNAEKHDYADWIAKNIKDEALASELRPIIQKQGIIDFLNGKIDLLSSNAPVDQAETTQQPMSTPTAPAPQIIEPSKAQTQPAKPKMDDTAKAKYLNVLLQTVNKVDEATFKTRVSLEKHDYADWIAKNIKDEALAEELKQITQKTAVTDFLINKIMELKGMGLAPPAAEKPATEPPKQQEQEQQQTEQEQQQERQQEQQQTEQEQRQEQQPVPNYLQIMDQNHQFVLPDGSRIASLPQLAETLPEMNSDHFNAHVNEHKNDFAAWIYHSIGDKKLAQRIGLVKERQKMTEIIISRVKEHNDASLVLSPDPSATESKTEAKAKAEPKAEQASEPTPMQTQPEPKPEIKPVAPTVEIKTDIKKTDIKTEAEREVKAEKTIEKPSEKPIEKSIESPLTKVSEKPVKPELDLLTMSATQILEKIKLITDATQYLAFEEEIKTEKKKRKTIKTGVPGFDDMIDQGIPANTTILMSGGPGSGKTTFCIQMLGWAAEQGEKCLFLTFEETEDQLIEHMESYGLDPKRYIQEGTLMVQRQDPFRISRMVEALLAHARGELLIDIDEIIDILPKGYKPDRIVVDSLSAIAAAFSESNTAYRIYITKLIDLLQKTGATSFLISEVQGIENIGHGLVEEFLADGVVVFYNLQKGNIKQSALEILKMRAVNHEKKIVPFEFVEGKGIIVYPLERTFI